MSFVLKKKRSGSYQIFFDAATPYPELSGALLPSPEQHLSAGRELPGKGRSCVTAVVQLNGKCFFLKKYEYRGLFYGLRHFFKASRAFRVFRHQRLAWFAGVTTPEPLLCIEERNWGWLSDCYILYEYLPESRLLGECWKDLPEEQRLSVLRSCGHALKQLHGLGLTHGDSNWRNVMIASPSGPRPRPSLVDFDGSIRPFFRHNKKFRKDIEHFLRDMRRRELPDRYIQTFLNAFQGDE